MDSNTPFWPEALPLAATAPLVRCSPQNIRTEMETGRSRNRRQFRDELKVYSLTWRFRSDEFDTFKTFFETQLVNGSLAFMMELHGVETEVLFLEGRFSFKAQDRFFFVSALITPVAQEI